MLFEKVVHERKAIFHLFESRRRETVAIETATKLLATILKFYIATFHPFGKVVGCRVVPRDFFHRGRCLAQCLQHIFLVIVEQGDSIVKSRLNIFGVCKLHRLLLKFFLFAILKRGTLNLFKLEA